MPSPHTPRPMGRKSPLDRELISRIEQAMAGGVSLKDAAIGAGISGPTAYRWRAHADDPEPLREHFLRNADFVNAVEHWHLCQELRTRTEKAEARAKQASLARIRKAGADGTWQADAWYLERRYPHEYGRRVQELSGPDGGPIEVVDARDKLGMLLDRLAAGAVDADDDLLDVSTNGHGSSNGHVS